MKAGAAPCRTHTDGFVGLVEHVLDGVLERLGGLHEAKVVGLVDGDLAAHAGDLRVDLHGTDHAGDGKLARHGSHIQEKEELGLELPGEGRKGPEVGVELAAVLLLGGEDHLHRWVVVAVGAAAGQVHRSLENVAGYRRTVVLRQQHTPVPDAVLRHVGFHGLVHLHAPVLYG